MQRTRALVFGSLIACSSFAGGARADDPPAAESVVPPDRELRLFHVAWSRGYTNHRVDRGPFPVPVDMVNDEENPLVCGESEEVRSPFGSIDDIIEIVKNGVLDGPALFNGDGVYTSTIGRGIIALRGPRALQDRVAAVLSDLERRELVTITVDVLALRGDPATATGADVAALVSRGVLAPLAAARACGFAQQTITARSGSDAAYIQNENVEVAQKAKAADPEVGIAKRGLAFAAELHRGTSEQVRVHLRAWWADVEAPKRVNMEPSGDPVETILTDGRTVDAILDLKPGAWSIAGGGGDVTFAVRATVRAHDTPSAPTKPVPMLDLVPKAPYSTHTIDVSDLAAKSAHTRGETPFLWPSSYAPPEPPELFEAWPEFPTDQLVESIRYWTRSAWEPEGTSLEWRYWSLLLQTDAVIAKATTDLSNGIRAGLGRTTRVRAIVVTLPLASIPEYLTGLDDGASLAADGCKALLARPGAQVIDRGGVLCRSGQRNASVAGKRHAYIGDYDVKIADTSVIGKPVNRDVLAGLSVDVEPRLAAGGAAVACELRIDRSTWVATRQVKTSYGDLECPTLGISRIHGATVLPLGSPRIVGATLDGGVVTLTILSATAE